MHELAVTKSILEISLRHAAESRATRIVGIDLAIGQLSSIVDDSVQFYWDMIADGTIARGARLHFHRIPAELRCEECGNLYGPDDTTFDCPSCASSRATITRGTEFRVESIEVE